MEYRVKLGGLGIDSNRRDLEVAAMMRKSAKSEELRNWHALLVEL